MIAVGFKSDREFLRNVSIGAVGTRKVAADLGLAGFQIIELERYCTSNKIWATKIKRLRVPDLLCLRSGIRIESRGKSILEITMSHSVNNRERAWDQGLRDQDLVAFVKCIPEGDGWIGGKVTLFRVGDLRATVSRAGLSAMKSAAEGSEIRLTWPAAVPGSPGTVMEVLSDRIDARLDSGRKQSYRLARKDGSLLAPNASPCDFLADLGSDKLEDAYVAAKALGFLDAGRRSVQRLRQLAQDHLDLRIRLEAAASLARLGDRAGWERLESTALDAATDPAFRMETALILSELRTEESARLLTRIASSKEELSELRAAAVWGLGLQPNSLSNLLPFVPDSDELTALHAIVAAARLVDSASLALVLRAIEDDGRMAAGLVRALLLSECNYLPETVRQIGETPHGARRSWLLYLLAATGRKRCSPFVRLLPPDALAELEFFWLHQVDNWTNRLDVADQIDYLARQS